MTPRNREALHAPRYRGSVVASAASLLVIAAEDEDDHEDDEEVATFDEGQLCMKSRKVSVLGIQYTRSPTQKIIWRTNNFEKPQNIVQDTEKRPLCNVY